MQNFKTATKTVAKLRSLLGSLLRSFARISYYCTYIKNFSRILKPLYDILHESNSKNKAKVNNRAFQLKHKTHREIHHQKIISEITEYLYSLAVVSYADFNEPIFTTLRRILERFDCSPLSKYKWEIKSDKFCLKDVIPCCKKLPLHSGKRELLALKWATTDRCSDYLSYRQPFEVYTDNNALTCLMNSLKLNAAGSQKVAYLTNYKFSMKYRNEKKNIDLDFISRNPIYQF